VATGNSKFIESYTNDHHFWSCLTRPKPFCSFCYRMVQKKYHWRQ